MAVFYNILFMLISYLIGSIPVSFIIGKIFKGIDLRKEGSGNLGSTNAFRILGKKLGITVFILDVLKATVILLLVKTGVINNVSEYMHPAFFGIMAVIGHCYSPFVKFKGGKAVACSLGVVLSLTPIAGGLCLITFGITLKLTGYVSLGSLLATLTVFIASLIEFIIKGFNYYNSVIFAMYVILVVLIIWKHRINIKNLINGTERSFKKKEK